MKDVKGHGGDHEHDCCGHEDGAQRAAPAAIKIQLPKQGQPTKSAHKHKHGHGHHHHHGPGHHHHHHGSTSSNIGIALLLNLSFAVVEIVGGVWTGSVAILSDAVHDIGDSLSLALAYFMEKKAETKSSASYSYGLRRVSLLSALITCTFLLTASFWVLAEAVPRLMNPVQPKTEGMFFLALLGIAVNGFAAWRVQRGGSMNEKVVSWHLIEDVLGWVAVLIGSVVMHFVDVPILDPLLSIGFTLFILYGVARSLRGTMRLFLQGVPEGFDLAALRRDIEDLDGVVGTHDAHLWSLDGESHVLTMHVVVQGDTSLTGAEKLKAGIRELVTSRGRIHVTIEVESDQEACPDLNCT